ncbi:radical SAM protein [Deltaproteobacteria bacterium]|nr:radical SAM protein [Deltaproteobacteria bacterium]
MEYIFGPVPSRRLGLSLGIDLIPPKTCTYNCLYCQVGRTTCLIMEPEAFVPVSKIIGELEMVLQKVHPDTITLAGSGEPTLHSEIDQVISSIKGTTDTRIALLTNGSLLWREEVRNRVSGADLIMPTLTTVFEDTFRTIHRPHDGLELPLIIEGLKELRKEYEGLIFLEVVLLSGINDGEIELEGLKKVIQEISPDKIQLNTVVRPPSDPRAMSIDMEKLEDIKKYFGERAEIIAGKLSNKISGKHQSMVDVIIEMAKRRPVTGDDIAKVLDTTPEETARLLKGLLVKGAIKKQEHGMEIYYIV